MKKGTPWILLAALLVLSLSLSTGLANAQVTLTSPSNGADLSSEPTFAWTGGNYDVYLFITVFYYDLGYWSDYYPVKFWLADTGFAMPSAWWEKVGEDTPCYWAVLGYNTVTHQWAVSSVFSFTKGDDCTDNDVDGYGSPGSPSCTYPEGDCDDGNADVNPGATEGPEGDPTCSDGLDNECDGATDEDDPGCTEIIPPPFLKVGLIQETGVPIANAVVVLGNPDGTLITSGTTDANGEITFEAPPALATVTAVWEDELSIVYDVNSSFLGLGGLGGSGTIVGDVSVNVIDHFGADYVCINCTQGGYCGDLYSPVDVSVYDPLQTDDKISFLAAAYDLDHSPIGYGFLLDQTFTDGMTVDISIDRTDFTNIRFDLSNIPPEALEADANAFIDRKPSDPAMLEGGLWEFSGESSSPIPAIFNLTMVPGIGDSFYYEVELTFSESRETTVGRRSATLADQEFNLSHALSIPFDLSISGAGSATPTLSWSGGDLSADALLIYLSNAGEYDYVIYTPPSRSSVVFPELPEELAAFRPTSRDHFSLSSYEASSFSGHIDLLNKFYQHAAGAWSFPADYSVRHTHPVGSE